ncbi:MAG TPA: hypothetical protein VIN05_06765 [Roseovarius sp.]
MSDPVTNVEIEDVLSSIRRLVSNDERPKPVAPPRVAPVPARVEADRLVLTPSLRIDDAAPDPIDHAADTGAPETGTKDSETVEAPRDAKAELKARVAELEEVVSRQADQWEPDGASLDANSGGPVAPLPWEEIAASTDEEADTDASADTGEAAHQGAARGPDISAPGLALDETADPAGDMPANPFEDMAADDSADADHSDKRGDRDLLATNDELIDQDALRDLVADIVRQELQGALGERITRNVRKLVRREIHRALASDELS